MQNNEPIHITVPGNPDDPRASTPHPPDGVIVHHSPPLHPDDMTIHKGIPVTSPSRTLIDLAEVLPAAELRACFMRAAEMGLLDPEQVRASRSRVEWRASLAMFDEVAAEFI